MYYNLFGKSKQEILTTNQINTNMEMEISERREQNNKTYRFYEKLMRSSASVR